MAFVNCLVAVRLFLQYDRFGASIIIVRFIVQPPIKTKYRKVNNLIIITRGNLKLKYNNTVF